MLALLLAQWIPVPARAETAAVAASTSEGYTMDGGAFTVADDHLEADFWLRQLPNPERVVMDRSQINASNARLFREDGSVHDLATLPATMPSADIIRWVHSVSSQPERALYDEDGKPLGEALDGIEPSLALDRIAALTTLQHGLVTTRADMRRFPTRTRVFTDRNDSDIDRFQETALFPGTPVVLLHESRDRAWWFAISPRYAAWIEKQHVAVGPADAVMAYTRKSPHRVVTGASVRTVHTPEHPAVSDLLLDMGIRLPLLTDWPANATVNGQHPAASHVIELPTRGPDGQLVMAPALLPRSADTRSDYLPLDRANVLRQAFKFLGERYGWGHRYEARDCSGFISEIYRSFGLQLPRNTGDQARSPVMRTVTFTSTDDRAARIARLRQLQVGDLVYIPGHVMLVIGQDGGEPWVIHDVATVRLHDNDGELREVHLNGVAVTPLLPLQADESQSYVDRITTLKLLGHP